MTDTFSDFRRCFVRIFGADQRPIAAGCLVGPRQVLTCAHVVADALGCSPYLTEIPAGEIGVDFPLLDDRRVRRASVAQWIPILPDDRGDFAGLLLTEAAPSAARPATLVHRDDLWGHGFRAYGFPEHAPGGEYASGRLLAAQATGWVQLEDIRAQGGRVQHGYSGGPVWDETLEGIVGVVVAATSSTESKVGYLIPSSTLTQMWPDGIGGSGELTSPYRGLLTFRELDADSFFGREQAVEQLLSAVSHRSMLAVLGPSGSGKSSLVLAGFVPALRRSGGWVIVDLRPGRQPYNSLASALLPVIRPDLTGPTAGFERLQVIPEVAALLAEQGLDVILEQIMSAQREKRLLIIVDQFEELYTLCPDDDLQRSFTDSLLSAVAALDTGHRPIVTLVLSLRADFLGRALAYRPLADALQGADIKLGPMTRSELRRAVEAPAARVGVTFEDGLVNRILDDLEGQPGNLPLLEFALSQLWEARRNRVLTHASYEVIGGVDEALARYADAIYLARPAAEQGRARRIFVQLVKPGEGTEDTRRLATAADLPSEDWSVVVRMADKRLIVTDRDPAGTETAELAHEALIRGWGRLGEWLASERDFRTWQERLRDAMRLWAARGEDEDLLFRGILLAEAEEWLDRRSEDVSRPELAFVERSRSRQDADEEHYRTVYQEALARQLVAQTELLRLGTDASAELATLLAVEALRRHPSLEADLALRRSLIRIETSEAMSFPNAVLTRPDDCSRDGFRMAAATRGGVTLSSLPDGKIIGFMPYTGWVHAVALTPDGRLVAIGADDGRAIVWQEDGEELCELVHESYVNCLAFSPDGMILATGSDDGYVHVWQIGSREEIIRVPHDGLVNAVSFSSDGTLLATVGQDEQARIWDATGGVELHRLPQVGDVDGVAFNAEGTHLFGGRLGGLAWPLRPIEFVARACELLTRDLTAEEWSRYLGSEPYRSTCLEARSTGKD